MKKNRWNNVLQSVSLVIGSVLLVLLGAEVFFHWIMPMPYLIRPERSRIWDVSIHGPSNIPGVDYELRSSLNMAWHGMQVITNSHGMRDKERSIEKPNNVIRIAAVGDSYTFGLCVDDAETWPAILETKLNEGKGPSASHYEVLNFGVSGYSSRDEALQIRHKVLKWNPDLIIIGYVLNDPEYHPFDPVHALFYLNYWYHSGLLRKLAVIKRDYLVSYEYGGNFVSYWHRLKGAEWQSVLAAFDDISTVTQEEKVPVLVVIFPEPPLNPPPDHFLHQIYGQIMGAAQSRHFRVINLEDAFAGHNYEELRLPTLGNHLNPKGYALAGEAISHLLLSHQHDWFKSP